MAQKGQRKNPDEVSRNMSAIRSEGNKTEVALRRRLHALGLRFRTYVAGLPGKPDIAFPSTRVAVFVDGDYWHARALRERGLAELQRSLQGDRQQYWIDKFTKRVARDEWVNRELADLDWLVLRYWESDTRKNIDGVADAIFRVVRNRREELKRQ